MMLLFLLIDMTLPKPLLGDIGIVTFSGITGFTAGFASKKVLKLVLLITGLLFIIFQVFVHYDMLVVNWPRVQTMMESLIRFDHSALTSILTAHLPETGGFVGGFLLGFRKG